MKPLVLMLISTEPSNIHKMWLKKTTSSLKGNVFEQALHQDVCTYICMYMTDKPMKRGKKVFVTEETQIKTKTICNIAKQKKTKKQKF